MSRLIVICGLPGSGKTTLARRLEAERPAVRLAPDEWLASLELDGYDEAARARVEALQWTQARAILTAGADVVLEWGAWARQERLKLLEEGRSLGALVELWFLDVPLAELRRRLVARNAALPADCFHVEPGDVAVWALQFEAPDAQELALFDPPPL